MKKICLIASLVITAASAFAGTNVIYGTDDRKDIYQVTNALHLKLAKSTAGMMSKSSFVKGRMANYFDLGNTITLERGDNVCPTEKFSQQPLAAMCSGFLVGPDTLVTAGHCYENLGTGNMTPAEVCKNFVWVFDYHMRSAVSDPTKNIPISNIYGCKEVIAQKRDGNFDYAVIRLDRKVFAREPLKFRAAGKVANTDKLMVIGHPSGLPNKVADNGKITGNVAANYFSTTLDTFHGNSGSAVLNSVTGLVEGILIMGKNDYRPSIPSIPESCQVVNVCNEMAQNCTAGKEDGVIASGEIVLRITGLSSILSKAIATPLLLN